MERKGYEAVVMGVSAGGISALEALLPVLSPDFHLPVLVVQHQRPDAGDFLSLHFDKHCGLNVKEAEDKEPLTGGTIYFAPANYHLLVEAGKTLALSTQEKELFSRPSIDVLFETAAEAYRDRLIGIILTGANSDGTRGMIRIKELGGYLIAQSPESAEAGTMPRSAIENAGVETILELEQIGPFVNQLLSENTE